MRKLHPFSFFPIQISIKRKCEGALLVLHWLERHKYFREGHSVGQTVVWLSSVCCKPLRRASCFFQNGRSSEIASMSKQHSAISIVNRSPVNARHHCRTYVGDTDDAISSYSTILHSRHFWPCAHVHILRGFILQSDWLLKILRGNGRQNIHGNGTRPLSRFFGRGLGTRLCMHSISHDCGNNTLLNQLQLC